MLYVDVRPEKGLRVDWEGGLKVQRRRAEGGGGLDGDEGKGRGLRGNVARCEDRGGEGSLMGSRGSDEEEVGGGNVLGTSRGEGT